MAKRKAIVIFGPTASGKSAMALDLAREKNGIIVNSDSLQVYKDLRVLSACPDDNDLALAPHYLYNVLDGSDNCTAVKYLKMLSDLLDEHDEFPIIVGGTGLYIKALRDGLAQTPDIPDDIRKEARTLPITEVLTFVEENDSEFLLRDEQRLRRAYEIIKAGGKPYSYWQKQPPIKVLDLDLEIITIAPEREVLYDRCNKRFEVMLKSGAIEEVETLLAKNYPKDATVMKAIGVDEISRYLKGEITYEDVITLASTKTRQYAKRQLTWMKTQL